MRVAEVESTIATYPWRMIPDHLRYGLAQWIGYGRMPGSFLEAVLRNDLRQAVIRADDVAVDELRRIVRFMINYVPSPSWGNDIAVERWGAHRGLLDLDKFEGKSAQVFKQQKENG